MNVSTRSSKTFASERRQEGARAGRLTDVGRRLGDHPGALADLAQLRDDKVRVEELDGDARRLELAAERLGPRLEERLAARVDGEQRRRDESGEGADGEDQATLASDHARYDQLRHLERRVSEVATGSALRQSAEVRARRTR